MPNELMARIDREARLEKWKTEKGDSLYELLPPSYLRSDGMNERTIHQKRDSFGWRNETPSPTHGAKYVRGEDFAGS